MEAPHEVILDESPVSEAVTGLVERAKAILAELESLREHLRSIRQERYVEVAHFRGAVQSELAMLQRLLSNSEDQPTKSTSHIAKSSNLPFLETVWGMAKKSQGLVALHKRVYYNSPAKSMSQAMHHINIAIKRPSEKDSRNAAVTVDTITNGGFVWIKVSLVTNTRLLYDLAKQGWDSGDDDDDDEENLPPRITDDDAVPLVKSAKQLCHAAQSYRVRTKQPAVHLILPRIQPGQTKQVDDVLDQCRAAGATLFFGEDLSPVPSIQAALSTMAPDPITKFSETLNICCTILLALVSEFSHARVSKQKWFHPALQRQVEIEGNENLLPSLLYPALGGRKLVCTKEAAKRMREIVETIGTASEKARTVIMMGDDQTKSQAELREEMQNWSAHPVPDEWQIPIRVVDQHLDDCQEKLPAAGREVVENMTDINRSVFGFGWASGVTTVTSNRVVVKRIENSLEKHEDLDPSSWPSIFLCPTARSLVGKEKEKRGVKQDEPSKSKAVWPLDDPLRREEQRRDGLEGLSQREGHPLKFII
jgi:hypothetical protein